MSISPEETPVQTDVGSAPDFSCVKRHEAQKNANGHDHSKIRSSCGCHHTNASLTPVCRVIQLPSVAVSPPRKGTLYFKQIIQPGGEIKVPQMDFFPTTFPGGHLPGGKAQNMSTHTHIFPSSVPPLACDETVAQSVNKKRRILSRPAVRH